MLEIRGSDLSIPSNKVRYVANALGLEYNYTTLNLAAGEHKSDAQMQVHPAGKVPAVVDGDFALFESNAICRYLARKCNSKLYPEQLQQCALVDQWIDFGSMHVGAAMIKVYFNRIIAPAMGLDVDPRSMEEGAAFLGNFLPIVEQQLSENENLAGAELSLADFNLLANLDPAELSAIHLGPYGRISAWRNRLKQQDFYQKCFNDYSDVVKAMAA